MNILGKKVKRFIFRKKWRKLNQHNDTQAYDVFDFEKVKVGKRTYGTLNVSIDGKVSELIIGNFCSIAENVKFLLGAEHDMNLVSTYPFKVKYGFEKYEAQSKGDIIVNDDVWIGYGAIIMSGVYIGQGAVIAAGAVVTKDVPAYAVVGGVPAKVIKYRFNNELIRELLRIDFSKLDDEIVIEHINNLYRKLDCKHHFTTFLKNK